MYYVLERKLTSEGITGLSNQFAWGSVKRFSLLFPVKTEKLEIKLAVFLCKLNMFITTYYLQETL